MKPILIKDILKNKKIVVTKGKRPINLVWEQADRFAKTFKLPTPVVMKWFKLYGINRVLNLESWAKDILLRDSKPPIGLFVWKLKNK